MESEKEQLSREEYLRWPLLEPSSFNLTPASDFQQEYIDIIPESWTAISLGLNEARDELYVTRFEAGVAPFVLRLPLARHASRDLDEDEFTFEDGKRDFDEIIELSDFSTRGAKDMTSREARQQWWDEREALDTRLHELLVNMENIWLGGFKGIFSQHARQPALLATFRKVFEDVLNRHLPSRSMKAQPKPVVLDTRVLELFIGLGDIAGEELDVDEELTDLIYFVVDILQFNGEANAIDEIDFDAMVIATQDALRAYHSAAQSASSSTPHTILMLDNSLHGFPWESLPCLQKLSVSRLPSLAALRERLLVADVHDRRLIERARNVLAGEGARVGLVALRVPLLEATQVVHARAIQLARGEAEPAHPLRLGEERVRRLHEVASLHACVQLQDVARASERAACHAAVREGRVGALGDLAQACAHHAVVQAVHE